MRLKSAGAVPATLVMETKEITLRYDVLCEAELTSDAQKLIAAAREATRSSYSPYSRFAVGAAVRLEDGTIVRGANQENVAYPSGLCAERVALFAAQAQYPDLAPVALAIAAYTDGAFTDEPITPCGACRQVMVEIEQRYNRRMELLLVGRKRVLRVEDAAMLVPLSFDF